MESRVTDMEKVRSDLAVLIARHKRTRAWFWRTGIASLVAAMLWIIIYKFASENAGVRETLAILVGAVLMWILFGWAFFLLRKLNAITAQVKKLEKKLASFFANDSPLRASNDSDR
jgi:Na+/melibiose symporter-like transporter